MDGSADVFCDNESVIKNMSRPESPLKKKKHNAVGYHQCCKACAADIIRIAKKDTKTNLSD